MKGRSGWALWCRHRMQDSRSGTVWYTIYHHRKVTIEYVILTYPPETHTVRYLGISLIFYCETTRTAYHVTMSTPSLETCGLLGNSESCTLIEICKFFSFAGAINRQSTNSARAEPQELCDEDSSCQHNLTLQNLRSDCSITVRKRNATPSS